MRSRRLQAILGAVTALPLVTACGTAREPVVPLAQHLETSTNPADASWAAFAPGQRVSVVATEGCVEQVASSTGSTSGDPLGPATWSYGSTGYTVVEASVLAGNDGHLGLMLLGDAGEVGVVLLPAGKPPTCVTPLRSAGPTSLASLLGKPLRFRPSMPACTAIEAAGSSLATALLADDPDPIVFKTLTAAPEHAGETTGPRVAWAVAEGADLRVRSDLLPTCFVPDSPARGAALEPSRHGKSRLALSSTAGDADGPQLLHIDPRRCKRSPTTRGEHLECSAPVGVWRGQRSAETVSLYLARRNVGTVHFLAGKAADARAFARTVVSVETAKSEDPAEDRLYAGIRTATAATLSSDESTRVAVNEGETPNLSILIDVSDVRVSDKTTRTEMVAHEYQDGTREEPNPKKAEALRKVRKAEAAIETAKVECQERKEEARRNYENCMAAAKVIADSANGKTEKNLRAAGTIGCTAYKIATSGGCSEVSEAQAELQEARSEEIDTSATIDVPIMKKASVKKQIFARRVTARVKMTSTLDGADLPAMESSFEAELTDYTVEANASIKLDGHIAKEMWLEDPKAAVPAVADKMAAWASTGVRSMLAKARLERARSTLRAAGEEIRPGFEALGGMALELADTRLNGVLKTGTVSVEAGRHVVLPAASRLRPNECLLVVAMLPEGSPGKLAVATADGSVADTRGKPYGSIEVCRSDVPGAPDALPAVHIKSDESSADVRWGEFRTLALADGDAASEGPRDTAATDTPPAPAPEAAAESPDSLGGLRPAPVESLTIYARAGAATWLAGSVGEASVGDVFTPAPSVGLGAGVRIGSGWLAYGEWERGFLGVGDKSPIVGFKEVASRNDTFIVGGRKTFTGWVVGSPRTVRTFVSPLIDLGLGYSVLRQEGSDVAGIDSRVLRLPSGALRLMTGVSVRPSRWYSIDPVFGTVLGWVNEIEATQTSAGTTRSSLQHLESGSIRASLFFGISGVLDVPFGEGAPPKPAKQTAKSEVLR